jgi:septum formation protein
MKSLEVILASQSPRRRELLSLVGIRHVVIPADVDESVLPDEKPKPHAERLARAKAEKLSSEHPAAVVIAADTIVVIDDDFMSKPSDRSEAAAMLRRLQGRVHTVMTGVAVAWNGKIESDVAEVEVEFRPLDDEEIGRYIDTGEPLDKAGAYGIQGYGATIVRRIHGDYFAVMGLSLVTVVSLLGRVGLSYRFGEIAAE